MIIALTDAARSCCIIKDRNRLLSKELFQAGRIRLSGMYSISLDQLYFFCRPTDEIDDEAQKKRDVETEIAFMSSIRLPHTISDLQPSRETNEK